MRTIQFLFIALFCINFQAGAQRAIYFGAAAGLNHANFQEKITADGYDKDDLESPQWRPGFYSSIYLRVASSENAHIRTGLSYIQKGFAVYEEVKRDNYHQRTRGGLALNYLELPFSVQLQKEVGAVKLYGYAGAAISYALNGRIKAWSRAKTSTKLSYARSRTDYDFEATKANRMSLGVHLGAGVIYPLENLELFADLRYQHGVNNLEGDPEAISKIYNRGIGLQIGFFLPIGEATF